MTAKENALTLVKVQGIMAKNNGHLILENRVDITEEYSFFAPPPPGLGIGRGPLPLDRGCGTTLQLLPTTKTLFPSSNSSSTTSRKTLCFVISLHNVFLL